VLNVGDDASMSAFYSRMAGYKYLLKSGSAEVRNLLMFHILPVYTTMRKAIQAMKQEAAKSEAAKSATA